MSVNYKEYSRLRSIARKRIERAAAAGKIPLIRIPTVAEVKASDYPELYMYAVQDYLKTPGAGLKWAKAENVAVTTPAFPAAPKIQKLSPEQKQERRRMQKRASKARQKIRANYSQEDAKKRISYIKGLQTIIDKWEKVDKSMAKQLRSMSTSQLQSFSDYMEYRFSQGDFSQVYVIDTFIRDFSALMEKQYNTKDLLSDFDTFLSKQDSLKKNKKKAEKHGITAQKARALWEKFIEGV